jgi:hypothetical protein
MDEKPLLVSALVNGVATSQALVDSGCLAYGIVSNTFVRHHQLSCVSIEPRNLQSVEGVSESKVSQIVQINLDIGGHQQKKVFLYVVPRIEGYEMILGKAWLRAENVLLDASRECLVFQNSGLEVYSEQEKPVTNGYDHKLVSASIYCYLLKRSRKTSGTQSSKMQVFTASLADINKALAERTYTDPRTKLPSWVPLENDPLFDRSMADRLPVHRQGLDHSIELTRTTDGAEETAPWGPLYNMSREELLVLRKTLTELLDKEFIRVSNSPAAAPVLFVRKPGGGLRFCCDYRALNKVTRKDRYPLPLIQETLQRIGKAKWFTKMDVIAAFHKIRIKEGDEWKTAFRTRFGLFEWLVTPFGLANAPSTFQRYINYTLQEFLDDFVSAYVDDILVFTDGTREQHREHVLKVLQKLQDAGLQLDIDKCEFEVQSTKYLGFIIEAGKGLRMDPAKIKAVQDWKAPTSAKGVLGFLGFANFYRRFIRDFSRIATPLYGLVKKNANFNWSKEACKAFERLKQAFIEAPILAQFDPDHKTVLETDSSGYCSGGVLLQYKGDVLRPIAFFSKKHAPAECNYPIYDKELLAIIRCLEEWEAELKSVGQFTVLTDHKNLEYFTTVRKLSERQMRWQLILSKFNPVIQYRPGKEGGLPDALTRRDQDLPKEGDQRLDYRMAQLIPEGMIQGNTIRLAPAAVPRDSPPSLGDGSESTTGPEPLAELERSFTDQLQTLWSTGVAEDKDFGRLKEVVESGGRVFPADLNTKIKVSVSDCTIDNEGRLRFRGRLWVPNYEPLRTAIVQELHDSVLTGHPGKNGTIAVVSREFFWPGLQSTVKQFVRNCGVCGRTKVWRDRKHGLLRPLPIPEQQWQEISVDFVGPLPISSTFDTITVFTDRLGKGVILVPCSSTITAEEFARLFIRSYYGLHGLPQAMVSDRGPQFIGMAWKTVCSLLGIERRLSTAFHPQTDGATERVNTEVEVLLRQWANWQQDDWAFWLPVVQLALNGRDSTSTGVSPFLLSHGYPLRVIDPFADVVLHTDPKSPIQKGEAIVAKVKAITEWAQSEMAKAQQDQEVQANRSRGVAPAYQVGDKVYLSLRNIRTERPSKKLDDRSAKFTILEVINPSSYRLDTPPGVSNVFNVDLLRPAATDPLPSQKVDDPQPPALLVEESKEYIVEKILGERQRKLPGKGSKTRLEYRVKWQGYARPTWEPATALEDTMALDDYLQQS